MDDLRVNLFTKLNARFLQFVTRALNSLEGKII